MSLYSWLCRIVYIVYLNATSEGIQQVRLTDSTTPFDGTVEVRINDTWWTFCYGYNKAENVICDTLDFSSPITDVEVAEESRKKKETVLMSITCGDDQHLTDCTINDTTGDCNDGYFSVQCPTPIDTGTCGTDNPLRAEEGWIFSPNFPNNYPRWQDCTWEVKLNDDDLQIYVTLRMLYLGQGGWVYDDFVEFYNIEGRSNPYRLTRKSNLRGVLTYHIGVTKSNILHIHFESSWKKHDLGFAVHYKAFDPESSSCDKNCENGGTCYKFDDVDICECPEGWKGDTCEEKITVCDNVNCNYGTCQSIEINGNDTAFCSCPDNYGGKFCEIEIGNCTSDGLECLNQGRCYMVDSKEMCECDLGWTGVTCNISTLCQNVTCHHGGTCLPIRENNTFVCICTDNYTGVNCEQGRDDISSIPSSTINSSFDYSDRDRSTGAKELGGAIGGVVVVVIAAIVIIVIAVLLYKRRTKKSPKQEATWDMGQSVRLDNVTYNELAPNTGFAASERQNDPDTTYYSSIDKKSDNIYNEADEVARNSASRENGKRDQENENTNPGTNNEGFIDNVAYESVNDKSKPEESGSVDNILYEGGDKSGESGFVDNIVYEGSSTDTPTRQDGFVDNIVYESTD